MNDANQSGHAIPWFTDFAEGPLWYVAATVFVFGVLWRIVGLLALGRGEDKSVPKQSGMAGGIKAILLHSVPHGGFFTHTAFHVIAGYMFHIGLFALLFFAAPHVDFLRERVLGFGWTPLPDWAFIVAAQISFAGLILLWVRRVADPVIRRLKDAHDYIGSGLTFLVMLTGCFALQESRPVLAGIHMFTVDIWLIYFPFSRLMHAFTFLFSRYYTGAFYGRRGVTP